MVEIVVTVTLRSPLNIGSGAQHGTLSQRGMLKDGSGWPYIPASALKGRWRHAMEQLVGSLPGQRVCQTHHEMCRQEACTVCQLFGSPWQRGRMRFVRLALSGPPAVVQLREKNSRPRTEERTGVAINRRRGVAQDNFLYNTELFLPGVPLAFSGVMTGEVSQSEAGLLAAALQLVPAMGRSKSAGLGWISAAATVSCGNEIWTPAMLAEAVAAEGANDE
ncbi:MAG: hypothetical protein KDE59_02770 [Anaerolineales bacterium]|nr:hypothetical protein [Anaerolineales bacterium]